jgi:hypothetical protein
MSDAFRQWNPLGRVAFGPGAITGSTDLIGEDYVLLTTQRAAVAAPAVVARAATMVEVPAGRVDTVGALQRAPGGAQVGHHSSSQSARSLIPSRLFEPSTPRQRSRSWKDVNHGTKR